MFTIHHAESQVSCTVLHINEIVVLLFLIINDCFLCEVEGLEVFATVAVTSIYKTEKLLSCRITIHGAGSITVLFKELFYSQIATTYSDNDLIFLNFHEYSFLAILINSFTFSFKAHFVADIIRHTVNEVSELLVQGIIFHRLINEGVFRNIGIVFNLDNNLM